MTQLPTPNPLLIARIQQALTLSKLSIYLGWLAIVTFLLGGSLLTLTAYQDSKVAQALFGVVPYVLVGVTIPVSLYLLWLMWRYQIIQSTILLTVLCLSVGLFTVKLFWAMVAWLAMPYLFRVNFARYLDFLLGRPFVPSRRQKKRQADRLAQDNQRPSQDPAD